MFDTKFLVIALVASVISLVTFVISVRYMLLGVLPRTNIKSKSGLNYILKAMLCFLISLWSFRYIVGYYVTLKTVEAGGLSLTAWEEIFNSFLHALQTFSMDEDYTYYVIQGKTMLRELFGAHTPLQTVHGVYSFLINTMAPIAGGAFVFEILARLFPKIRLYLSSLFLSRPKYYFSELNDASLALATSVFEAPTSLFKRPYLIFTDAYIDNKEEGDSELITQAQALGAICVRDDLAHVFKSKRGKRYFFLIDKSESGNMQTFVELADDLNDIYLLDSEVYLFTNSDAYIEIENRVMNRLKKKYDLDNWNNRDKAPIFIPVLSYRNLISNLLVDVPLYEPLINKPKNAFGENDLTVTILGAGHIGTQMFLSTYWFGQMLNCNLKINVVSQGSEEEFWSKIDYINPEIRKTTIKNDPILRINNKGDMAPVYCDVKYVQCNVKSSEFISSLTNGDYGVLDTDYFFVAIGSDKDNISVANTIRKYVGQHNLSLDKPTEKIITYVVYNSTLSDTLNEKTFYSSDRKKNDIYMRAVGSRKEVYSYRNVFMEEHEAFANEMYLGYLAAQEKAKALINNEFEGYRIAALRKGANDEYNHWANRARAMHIKYREFSMGCISSSFFDYSNNYEAYLAERKKDFEAYASAVKKKDEEKDKILLDKMAWLEHRRWNAFMRVMGFRHTDDYLKYAEDKGSYKQMQLKLHPCLVECDKNGIRKDEIGNSLTLCTEDKTNNFDLLDELSHELFKSGINDFDFKEYDYPFDIDKSVIKSYDQGDKNV